MRHTIVFLVVFASAATILPAGEWPQWRGPDRDGRVGEARLATAWDAGGPPELWRIPVGDGFSGVAVVGDRLFTAWRDGEAEVAVALDARSGRGLWRTELGGVYQRDRGDGPRATPTVEGDRVFVLSGVGYLAALSTKDGRQLWARDLRAEPFRAKLPTYGFTASPLVVGKRLIVPVGGEGQSLVAFGKATGEVAWSVFDDPIGYSSPVTMTLAGTQQIVTVTGQTILGVGFEGRVLWSHPWPVNYNIHVATPIRVSDSRVFVSASYDMGAVVLEIRKAGEGFEAVEIWRNRTMKNHFQDSVYHEGHLYGFDNAFLKCVDAGTGETRWRHRGFGKGQLLLAGGKLVVLGERGRLAVSRATPEAYVEHASVPLPTERYWTPPSLSRGVLYVRNDAQLLALDVRAGTKGPTAEASDAAAHRPISPVSVESLIERNLDARGSADAWKDVRVLRMTGRFNRNGRESTITVWRHASGKSRYDVVFKDRRETFVYDGAAGWFRELGERSGRRLSGAGLERRLDEVDAYLPWRDPWGAVDGVKYVGEETTETEPRYRLRVGAGSATEEWSLSSTSFQIVQAIRGAGEERFVSYPFDYRPVDGLVFPHYVEASFGTALNSLNVERIEVNLDAPEDVFRIPG